MKLKVGDKVESIGDMFCSQVGTVIEIDKNTYWGVYYRVRFPNRISWKKECNLKLIEAKGSTVAPPRYDAVSDIRIFPSGSTRDTSTGKLSYMKALSPEVLEAYVMYLDKHRKLPDGSLRAFDNWKQGIDMWVYLDSLLRHDKAVWKLMLGYEVSDNHGKVILLDSLMAIIFNAMGLAYELLIEEGKAKRCVQSS